MKSRIVIASLAMCPMPRPFSTRAGRPGVGFGANINRTDRTGANRRFVHSIKSPGGVVISPSEANPPK